ncbi:Cyclomaltodextrin glucanotransferase [Photobacterium marinum]|uniref:Cyclomaltodextrin glucanotransferase n=1 Tax=Photobacterium marinum TaxID=1056511 RepID=L8JEF7_9GAMM|nr:alpha-amylase family glycosyl hydrolase [Photobacterium marinum]ELR65919.1 Cyclomaltodextrin glucanotransferase [Photobacterium marinum]
MKKSMILLSALVFSQAAIADWNQAYFRGTPNGWQSEAMTYMGDNQWQIIKTFRNGADSLAPSFKIDRYGNWQESYPQKNFTVDPNKTYIINFYDDTQQVFIHEKPALEMRDRTMYFVFLDRFSDGDSSNNVGHDSRSYSADGSNLKKYQGGDIRGLINKLDYLKDMGVGAIWITPPIDNVDGANQYGDAAYHGYWGKDFFKVDEHLGTLDDFKELVAKMHSPVYDMKLVLDYAPNHSNPNDEMEFGALYRNGQHITNYQSDVAAGTNWYHHNGGVNNWNDWYQVTHHNLFNLTDFDQNNQATYNYLTDGAKFWIDMGVDAIRIDAIKHMEKSFIQRWTGDLYNYAQSKGRGFFFFGEWFGASATSKTGIDGMALDYANTSGSALLDFGLRDTMERVLTNRTNMYTLNNYLKERDTAFTSSDWQVTFLDNHDMARISTALRSDKNTFGPSNNEAGGRLSADFARQRLELGLAVIMTSRGIPCIYYGTEQYAANFTVNSFGQVGSDPFNREVMPGFDQSTPAYSLIKKLSDLRDDSFAIQQGNYVERWVNENVLVFERNAGDDVVLVAANIGPTTSVNVQNIGLANGTYQNLLDSNSVVVADGNAQISLKQNEVVILRTIQK